MTLPPNSECWSSPLLVRPKYAALDSSHLVQWADARTSADAPRRMMARQFEQWLNEAGYIPLLSLHHISELMNHEIEAVAARRLRFIAELPFVAWIGSPGGSSAGTVLTLFEEEVRAALTLTDASLEDVRDEAKQRLIRAGAGAQMLGFAPEKWLLLRRDVAAQAGHAREVVALTRLGTVATSDKPLSALFKGELRRGDTLKRHLDRMEASLAVDISRRGDKRIADPAEMAAAFMRTVEETASALPANPEEFVRGGLATLGVTAEDIMPTSTLGEMLTLGLFRGQLKVAAESAGIFDAISLRGVAPTQIPTWLLSRTLDRYTPTTKRREGGELTDSHLACLAAYVDVATVDKRTWEAFRQLRQKEPRLAQLLGRVERAADFAEIPALLKPNTNRPKSGKAKTPPVSAA